MIFPTYQQSKDKAEVGSKNTDSATKAGGNQDAHSRGNGRGCVKAGKKVEVCGYNKDGISGLFSGDKKSSGSKDYGGKW